jgi:hypothetical protein
MDGSIQSLEKAIESLQENADLRHLFLAQNEVADILFDHLSIPSVSVAHGILVGTAQERMQNVFVGINPDTITTTKCLYTPFMSSDICVALLTPEVVWTCCEPSAEDSSFASRLAQEFSVIWNPRACPHRKKFKRGSNEELVAVAMESYLAWNRLYWCLKFWETKMSLSPDVIETTWIQECPYVGIERGTLQFLQASCLFIEENEPMTLTSLSYFAEWYRKMAHSVSR